MNNKAITALVILIFATRVGTAAEEPPQPIPGQEKQIADAVPGGASGYFTLYLPKDYSPDRAWPLIVYYHGGGAKPESGQMRHINDGRGFVIVGMQYIQGSPVDEAKDLMRVLDRVERLASIDRKRVLIGGASMGAGRVPRIATLASDEWSAMYLLSGAGRLGWNERNRIAGRPVFLGAGETDSARPVVERQKTYYEEVGAEVTFVIFEGIGHACDPEDTTLIAWFLTQGGIADRYPRDTAKEKQ